MILRDMRKQIENIVNQSGLSIDMIYFLFKDIMIEIENVYIQECQKADAEAELKRQESESKEENSEAAANKEKEKGGQK